MTRETALYPLLMTSWMEKMMKIHGDLVVPGSPDCDSDGYRMYDFYNVVKSCGVYETNSCGKPNHKANLWTKTAFNTPQMDPNRKNAVPGVWLIFGLTMVYQIPLQDSRERWKSKRDNGKTPFWLGRMWCHMICLQIGDLVIAMLGHDLNIFDDFSWRRCCFPISPCCCL